MNILSTVESCIFDEHLSINSINKAFDAMQVQSSDLADVYMQHNIFENRFLEEGMVKSGSFSIRRGFGVRKVCGESTAFAYADNLTDTALLNASSAIASMGNQGQNGSIHLQNTPSHSLYQQDNPLTSIPEAEKIAILQKADDLARSFDPRVIEVTASLSSSYDYIWLSRNDGRVHADIRPLVRFTINVVVEENGRREYASAGGGGRYTYAYFDENRLNTYVQQAVTQAITNLSAMPAPAGEMTVVLGSGWSGVLLHEAVGHGLEGDFNRKGTSVFTGKIGQRVAAKGVTVIDQGNIPHRRGSLNMDDEGNLTQKNILIEDGILCGYLQDETNARLMNVPVTGNGRRESYASVPIPRMTNTYMENGSYDPQEIIASVKKGIYAVHLGGGQVDITSGQFVFSTSEAWLIENGQLKHPVKGATLVGNGAQTLQHISMIGNDMSLDSGVGICGKDGQSVPVGVGQPTLRIDAGLTVGGSQVE
ncbi:MAG: metalloprotease TldD [Neisseriaceae bacterium]|nr:metalloprotease TldD [Neisseriaceae bacterium]